MTMNPGRQVKNTPNAPIKILNKRIWIPLCKGILLSISYILVFCIKTI